MIVGATHRGGEGGELTFILAEAVPPVPPSTELTGPVVLSIVPVAMAVTFTENAHEVPPASVAPVKLTTREPAAAAMAPPPQLPASPFGVETLRPPGSGSVKPTPVKVLDLLGLSMVKLSEIDSFTSMVTAPKDFAIIGGAGTTVMLAEAVLPVPALVEVTVTLLVCVPTLVPVTLTPKVHEADPASVAPVKLISAEPGVAAMLPPPQVPVSPFGVETTRPGGSVSRKPTPVKAADVLGLLMVNLSEVEPFSGMVAAPKPFAIDGGEFPDPLVMRTLSMMAPALTPCPVVSLTNVMVSLSPVATKVKTLVVQKLAELPGFSPVVSKV